MQTSLETIDLIVFDWDGTLMDSTRVIARSLQDACRDVGIAVPSERDARFVIGLGAYQNSLEGLLRQARVGLAAAGPQGGVSFFSLAATNAPVVDNPLSLPAGRLARSVGCRSTPKGTSAPVPTAIEPHD